MKNKKLLETIVSNLKKEYNQLSVRINNLDIFILLNCDNFDKEYMELLKTQKDLMIEYEEILYQRIKYIIAKYN